MLVAVPEASGIGEILAFERHTAGLLLMVVVVELLSIVHGLIDMRRRGRRLEMCRRDWRRHGVCVY